MILTLAEQLARIGLAPEALLGLQMDTKWSTDANSARGVAHGEGYNLAIYVREGPPKPGETEEVS